MKKCSSDFRKHQRTEYMFERVFAGSLVPRCLLFVRHRQCNKAISIENNQKVAVREWKNPRLITFIFPVGLFTKRKPAD